MMPGDWDNYTAKSLWEHELGKLGRHALLSLVSLLFHVEAFYAGGIDHDQRLKLVRDMKKSGRIAELCARMDRMNADPHGEMEKYWRRKKSAKAAANRRKKAVRLAKKQAQRLSSDPCSLIPDLCRPKEGRQ
jgi:hypothetical protein